MLLHGPICVAQDESYKEQIDKMVEEAENFDNSLKTNPLEFSSYDKWYKDFKKLSKEFEKDFSSTHKQKKSFQSIEKVVEELSFAWTMLHQAKYAQEQYQESITLNQVDYAHKWKSTEVEERKKALEAIAKAVETLKDTQISLQEEEK